MRIVTGDIYSCSQIRDSGSNRLYVDFTVLFSVRRINLGQIILNGMTISPESKIDMTINEEVGFTLVEFNDLYLGTFGNRVPLVQGVIYD